VRKKESGTSDDNAQMLETLAQLLDDHSKGKSLDRHQAAAYRDVLRRMARQSKYTRAQRKEMRIAVCFLIRKELAGPGRGNAKAAAAATAKAYNVTDGTVNTLGAERKKFASDFIEITAPQHKLSRTEFLKHQLELLESDI
jgi:hypothetical protein